MEGFALNSSFINVKFLLFEPFKKGLEKSRQTEIYHKTKDDQQCLLVSIVSYQLMNLINLYKHSSGSFQWMNNSPDKKKQEQFDWLD